MKVKFADKIYDVLYSMNILGKPIYAVEDEPNHIDWLVNVEIINEKNPLKGTLGDVFNDLKADLDPSPKQDKPKFKAGDTIQCISDKTDKRTIASSICTGICETCTLNPCPNWEDINCAAAGR